VTESHDLRSAHAARRPDHRVLRPDEKAKGGPTDGRLSRGEELLLAGLCSIYALRIVGMYLVLPVLSPYANTLRGATSLLTGLSLGAYGLSQGLLQIPFGHLSDRIGRKRAIAIGILLFTVGSVISALARDIRVLIAGRLLQGSGAVAAAVVALIADLTRPVVRTQAMARVGVWLGASFAFGMAAGPPLANRFGVPPLFWATAICSFLGALFFLFFVPDPRPRDEEDHPRANDLRWVLAQPELAMLNVGTALLHATLTAIFVILPFRLGRELGLEHLWKVTVPLVSVGLAVMASVAHWADRRKQNEVAFLGGAALFVVACALLAGLGQALPGLIAGTVVFILAVACLEPALPALTSRFAVGPHRGTAIGVFHSSQFLGSFFGGLLGGAFLKSDARPLYAGLGSLVAVWIWVLRRQGGLRPRG